MNRTGFHLCFGVALTAALVAWGCQQGEEAEPVHVSMTAPTDQSYVSGEVTVTVEVSGPVENVSLLVDDAALQTLQSAPWSFQWDTSSVPEGLHTLKIVANGNEGQQGRSADCRVIVDRTPPLLSVPELSLPAVFAGADNPLTVTAEDEAGLLAVRLRADDTLVDECDTSPCEVSWDVSALPDGPVELTFEAEDLTGNVVSQVQPVLVVNDGTVIELLEGDGSGAWTIPESWATMDLDMKFHWTMPAGTTEIMAALQWTRAEWPFELAIGTGECPHSGTEHASTEGEGGQVILPHTAQDLGLGQYDADQMWFIHLAAGAALDMAANVGEGTRVGFVVVLY